MGSCPGTTRKGCACRNPRSRERPGGWCGKCIAPVPTTALQPVAALRQQALSLGPADLEGASAAAWDYLASNGGPAPAGPVVLHLSSGEEVTVDPTHLDDLEGPWAQAYLRGHCFDLAVALHGLTGAALVGVVDKDMADRCPNGVKHVGVMVEEGLMLDIEGPDTDLSSIGDDDPAVSWRLLTADDVAALASARGPERNVPLARLVAERLLDSHFEDWRP